MRLLLLICMSLTCCLAVLAQARPLPSPEPVTTIINAPSEFPPDRIWWPSFMYEDRCGSPLVESMVWALIEGKVVSVTDGNKITIVLKDKRRKQVRLVGIDAPKPGHIFGEESRRMLSGLVLNQEVEVIADFHSDKSEELTGIIHVKAKDVNLALIEAGLARYQEPVAYSMSNYTACTYRIVEGEARAAKRGLWQNVSR